MIARREVFTTAGVNSADATPIDAQEPGVQVALPGPLRALVTHGETLVHRGANSRGGHPCKTFLVFASISFLAAAASSADRRGLHLADTSRRRAVRRGRGIELISPSGTQRWVIAGVPYARSGLASAAGQVEFFPTINSPTAPPFTISAPIGHIQASAHFGWSVATADFDGDGTMDVVVGAPDQDVGSVIDQGRAFVFSGHGRR
ncbi:MAG: FG-GAP repeat protein [Planctomycetota bacterium]